MATALDVLKRSMRMLGVYSIGEDPSAEETADGIAAFNALIGTLSNGPMIYAKTLDTIALSATVGSITVGPTGGTVTSRPVRVLPQSYITYQGVSYPLDILTLQEYNDVPVKATQGIPVGIWVQPDMPDITVTFWPIPSEAMTLNLWSDKVLSSTLTPTTQLSFPPGYEDAFAYLLAEAIAPEYEVDPLPKAVEVGASRSRRLLKRTNRQIPRQAMDVPGIYGVYDWRTGA